jgi:hypothetical protein
MFHPAIFIHSLDEAIVTAWRSRNWQSFVKLWLASSVGVTAFVFLLIYIPGILFVEGTRVYRYFKVGGNALDGVAVSANISLLYSGLWNFAVAFAAITLVIALLSCPLTMIAQGAAKKQ